MTGHTRPLPTGRPIASALRRLFARMRDDAGQRMATGRVPDLSAWLPTMIEVMEPVLLPLWAMGARYSLGNLRRQAGIRGKCLSRAVRKDLAGKPTILFDFDLFNPRILTAIRQQVYNFCEETLATLTLDVAAGYKRSPTSWALGWNRARATVSCRGGRWRSSTIRTGPAGSPRRKRRGRCTAASSWPIKNRASSRKNNGSLQRMPVSFAFASQPKEKCRWTSHFTSTRKAALTPCACIRACIRFACARISAWSSLGRSRRLHRGRGNRG